MTITARIRLFLGIGAVALSANGLAQDTVRFQNGDLLRGSLEAISPETGLTWRRPDAAELIQFDTAQVTEVEFPSTPPPVSDTPNQVMIRFPNLDELEGTLVSCDDKEVILETWFAGRLVIPRQNILLIAPLGPPKKVVFDGPKDIESWTKSKVQAVNGTSGEWRFKNNALYATESASIARDLKLPDTSSLEFDLEWRGFFYLAIALYTDYLHPVNLASKETEPDFGGFYSMQVNSFSANLLPVTKADPLRYLGQSPVQGLSQRTSAKIDIRTNKEKRTFALLIDGVVVKEWNDPEQFAGKGTAVRFVHQGQGAVKISNIRVSEWDGYYEEKATNSFGLKSDLVKLRNGDRIFGAVQSVANGSLEVKGQNQTLQIPLARVKQIDFENRLLSTNAVTQARALFQSGGPLTFNLQSWTTNQVTVEHPLFGKAQVKPVAFSKLEFLRKR